MSFWVTLRCTGTDGIHFQVSAFLICSFVWDTAASKYYITVTGSSCSIQTSAIYSKAADSSGFTWYNVVVIKNGTGVYLYVNNEEAGSWVGTETNSYNVVSIFGGNYTGSDAHVQEFAIWNTRAITEAERTQVYNSGDGWPIL
jgi:hypothetical protein